MPDQLVTGIFPSSDVSELERALGVSAALDQSKLSVITSNARTQAHDDSFLNFVHVAEYLQEDTIVDGMTHGQGMMTDSGGTGVPGGNSRGPSLGSLSNRGSAVNYLAGVKIPGDQIDNFNDAIGAGRVVVLYDANDEAAADAVSTFCSAGFRNVKAF